MSNTQDRHIEFLQATLEFTLSQGQRSRDFSTLDPREEMELKRAYCRQLDDWFMGSSLTNDYRGCELDVLTNNRIEFKLYFKDDKGPPKDANGIMEILARRAVTNGQEGHSVVKISDLTLDISPQSASVDLSLTSKPEDFSVVKNNQVPTSPGEMVTTTKKTTTTTAPKTTAPTPTTTTTEQLPTTMNTTAKVTTSTSESDTINSTVLSKDICQSIDASHVVAHPFSCGHYIQCQFDQPIVRPCSGGLVFDPARRACVKPRNDLPCTEIYPCANVNGGHFAHPTDCRLFVICDQGQAVVRSCPPGLVWDSERDVCVTRRRGTSCKTG